MKKTKRKILSILPAAVMMIVIFAFSAQRAEISTQSSDYIALQVQGIWGQLSAESGLNMKMLTFLVRKLAHMTEYAVLAICLCFYGERMKYEIKRRNITALIVGILYAVSDEFHQYFVPGRSCEVRDVCIDSIGVVLGTLIFYVILKCRKKRSRKKNRKPE